MPRRATPTGASVAARATCELVRAYKDAKLASLFSAASHPRVSKRDERGETRRTRPSPGVGARTRTREIGRAHV